MPPGLSAAGLEIARLEDIKAEIEADLRSALGQTINLLPTESLGQYVGIQASKYAKLWELVQDVYNSEDPHNANGVSLDRRVALTGHKRLEGNPSTATVTAFGTQGTLIDIGDLTASVEGDPEAVFVNVEAATIGAGTDEVQTIGFNTTPDEGSFTLIFNGEETTPIDFSDNAAAVQSALNALPNLEGLTVTGSFAADFVVTFEGPFAESPQPLLTVGVNTLETSNVAVSVTITETTPGVFPNVDIDLEATEDGPTQAKAGFLTVIETPIVGLDSISNALDAVPGKDVETDAELKIRREETLANPGTATLDAIVARLREIDEVEDAVGYENFTEAPDAEGRPMKSVEAVVLGASDQVIAETIWRNKAAGIRLVGNTSFDILDSQGFTRTINFSRPSDLNIWIIAEIEVGPEFPVDGDTLVEDNLLAYAAESLKIGDDVIVARLVCPVVDVPGVLDVTIKIGIAPAPTLSNNIPVDDTQVPRFASARISVVHV